MKVQVKCQKKLGSDGITSCTACGSLWKEEPLYAGWFPADCPERKPQPLGGRMRLINPRKAV